MPHCLRHDLSQIIRKPTCSTVMPSLTVIVDGANRGVREGWSSSVFRMPRKRPIVRSGVESLVLPVVLRTRHIVFLPAVDRHPVTRRYDDAGQY